MRVLFLAPLALLLSPLVLPCQAGWRSAGCTTVVVPEWEWRVSADGSRADLYHYGCYWRSHYYETEEKKPLPDGRGSSEEFPQWMTHGTDPEKLAPSEEYRVGGQLVSKDEAMQALRAGQLTDDSGKLRLTVIGNPEERKKALTGLPADVKDHCLLKEYTPDNWAVKNAGFKTDGHPTVYVQAPDGKVLHRQDDPDNLATAVRKADPNYDPSKDPDLRKPKVPDTPAP